MENPIWGPMNMLLIRRKNSVILLISLLCMCILIPRDVKAQNSFRIISYNVENLFDCWNDSLINDEGFLPNSMRGWTYKRYQQKLVAISKVIAAMGEWDTPLLVGLCEVENRSCLKDLCTKGGLKAYGYDIIHYDSPDRRGIDVALMFDKNAFTLLASEAVKVGAAAEKPFVTRDILYAKGIVAQRDTLHVFMCHFPSRWSGMYETQHLRMEAAGVLRHKVDSITTRNPHALIVIMGDFNDEPTDKSMAQTLAARPVELTLQSNVLYNLMSNTATQQQGTHYYQGQWNCFDQIIVSGALLTGEVQLRVAQSTAHVFKPEFLLIEDEKELQQRPWRTYNGMKYWGGFSDHLPVYVDLEVKQ